MEKYLKNRIKIASMFAGFFLLILVSIYLFGGNYITGNLLSETHSDIINKEFTSDSVMLWNPTGNEKIESISISGLISGIGYYELILIDGSDEYLIYASSIQNSTETIKNYCIDSCNLNPSLSSDKYFIRVNINGDVSVNLNSINYVTKGSSQEFVISSVAGETCTPESATECETGSERILTCTNTGYGLDWTATTDC
ncbi:hypothetical protein KY334_04430, partial [Candidatus Woesearchaeota archaeon]|nr:hypothetical protein [Candidatus Woesearchaeota archaeon]